MSTTKVVAVAVSHPSALRPPIRPVVPPFRFPIVIDPQVKLSSAKRLSKPRNPLVDCLWLEPMQGKALTQELELLPSSVH